MLSISSEPSFSAPGVDVDVDVDGSEVGGRQGEAEQADPDQAGADDRQHHVSQYLPRAGAQIAGRFLEGAVEAIEDRKHDEQAEGQGPGQVRAEPRAVPRGFQAGLVDAALPFLEEAPAVRWTIRN